MGQAVKEKDIKRGMADFFMLYMDDNGTIMLCDSEYWAGPKTIQKMSVVEMKMLYTSGNTLRDKIRKECILEKLGFSY